MEESQARSAMDQHLARLSGIIYEVEECSLALEKYWLCKPTNLDHELTLAATVRARFAALGVFYGEAGKLLSLPRVREYQMKQLALYKEGTGGDFENTKRDLDCARAIESYRLSREIVQCLRLGRRERLSPLHRIAKYWPFRAAD